MSARPSAPPRWVDVGAEEDFPRRGARVLVTPAGNIAVFRTGEDSFHALDDSCPHRGGPLSQGMVCATTVSCPLHELVIDLTTGLAVDGRSGHTSTYPVESRDGRIHIHLPAPTPIKS